MNINDLKEYLLDFHKREIPPLVERDMKVEESKKIKSIIGPRRAGKTYFLYQEIKELLNSGVKKENIIYLNFEDPRLIDITFKEVREIIKLNWQLFPSSIKEKTYIFVDEPQNIKNWEIAIRALQDEGFYIFITGSSSKLLSREISTSLRGRTISSNLLPFSFKEFLRMRNINPDISRLDSREKSILLNLLDEYIEYGGFPEIIQEINKENKLKILNEYLNSIVYKDVVERYKIKNTLLIKWLIKSLIMSFSRELSVHKIYLTLKSRGLRISKNTLYYYLSLLEESIFVFLISRFNYSIKKRELTIHKIYLCDIGFSKLVEVTKDRGYKIENIVFLELKRKENTLTDIFYWQDIQKREVDFVIKEGSKIKQLIQVCLDVNDITTKKRELTALIKASKELKCNNLLIITEDKEGKEVFESRKIKYISLWKWLLE